MSTSPAADAVSATLSTTSVAFGSVTAGTSATQYVTLSNEGSAPLLNLSVSLDETTDFASSSSCGSMLAAGASCMLTLTFRPTAAGDFRATVSLKDSAYSSPQNVQLSGTGAAVPLPQASLSPGSVSFADLYTGSSAASTVTLTNTGKAALSITGSAVSDTLNFALTNTCGASLAPAASCSLAVVFQPQARGSYAATLTVTDNAGGVPGSTQTVSLSGAGFLRVSSVANFGDSITCGSFASPANGSGYVYSLNGYAGLFDAALAVPSRNFCRSTDEAADTARLWVQNVTPALGQSQLSTVLIGTNDVALCGSSAGCMANYRYALQAALAWLALPASDKVLANSIPTRRGNWTTDLYSDLATTSAGATLDFTVQQVVANRPLYVAFRVADPGINGGAAAVTVDGAAATTLSTIASTGHTVLTPNGTADTIFLAQLPLGAAGAHSVHIQTTSADGAYWALMWAGVSTGNYASVVAAPRVLVGGIITSLSAPLNTTIAQYNSLLSQTVADFQAQGLNIQMAPTANALDPSTDFVDTFHPNTGGHVKLAAAFTSVL